MKDRTPKGDKQQAAIPSGEVFEEYGVVDLNHHFPAEEKIWDPGAPDSEDEHHVVVPFRVVERGFKNRSTAQVTAKNLEEEEGGSFKAVQLSDMRGL